MKATVKNFKIRKVDTKDGKQFEMLDYTCDVQINDKGEIKTLKGSMSTEYARKYFAYCGVKTTELINKTVDVVVSKRKYENANGEERTTTFIKYLNVLNTDGSPIVMPKDSNPINF